MSHPPEASQTPKPKGEREVFLAAIKITDPRDRDEYLDRVLLGQPDLKRRVQQLISVRESGSENLLQKAVGASALVKDDSGISHTRAAVSSTTDHRLSAAAIAISEHPEIGGYKLLELIGEGGMGSVYLAQQSEPVRREVALKIIKPGMDSRQVIARFEAERQALAMMEHPNIAKVLDAGTTETGLPYFVMELVRGIPISDYCDRAKMSTPDRLELFCDACAALQHAHNKGVIHRDIKPSNILVTEHDGTPVVKVIDFGVAKALTDNLTDKTLFTGMFQMIGTPLYMSPEQASLSNLDTDVRSDVYSLGVMLYELVSGTLPIDRQTAKELSLEELRRRICDTEPPRPSKRLSTLKDERETIAESRGLDVKQLYRIVSGEVDWIVMKAIDKDRRRRYQSARELAEDVRRYLDGDVVEACPPSAAYRLKRYAHRNRWLLTTAGLVLFTMTIGTVISLKYAIDSDENAAEAAKAQKSAEDLAADYKSLLEISDANASAARSASELAERESSRARQTAYRSDIRLAANLVEQGLQSEAIELLDRHLPTNLVDDLRDFEWYHLMRTANQSELSWQASQSEVMGIDWSPDDKLIATVDRSGACKIWDSATGRLLSKHLSKGSAATSVRFNHDGSQLAWGTTPPDASVRVWNRESGKVGTLVKMDQSIWSIQWSEDNERLLVGSISNLKSATIDSDPTLHLFKLRERQVELLGSDVFQGNVRVAEWNHDGSTIWAINGSHDGQRLRAYSEDLKRQQSFDPVGLKRECHLATANQRPWIAVVDIHGWCKIIDEHEMTEIARFRCHWTQASPAWSPDDGYLATCGMDGFVKLWAHPFDKPSYTFGGHQGQVHGIAWSKDGQRLVSCGADGKVFVWRSGTTIHPSLSLTPSGSPWKFYWTSKDKVRYNLSGFIKEIDVSTGVIKAVQEHPSHTAGWQMVSADVSIARKEWTIVDATHSDLAEMTRGTPAHVMALQDSIGLRLACITQGRSKLKVIDSIADPQIRTLQSNTFTWVRQMRWAPRGTLLALVGKGLESDGGSRYAGWLHLVDGATMKIVGRKRVGSTRNPAFSVDWSADAAILAVGNDAGYCGVYDAKSLELLCEAHPHRAAVNSISLNQSGTRVASGGVDQSVVVWDATSGNVLLRWNLDHAIHKVAWSLDGRYLAALTADGKLHLWDSTPTKLRASEDRSRPENPILQ
ncbi:MAG: serine/threonine-protein kinase [Planctomycetota bacterium]